ncbi:MAG: hypothetical protein ACTSW1_19700 [Candidatus Hodarchaeales archaeon]
MVKLFKKKKDKKTQTFKFETSIKLKNLPLEEYAHVAFAFQVSSLRFERMLKESLLESHITSTTLEHISQGFKFAEIRSLEIPKLPSLEKVFGSSSAVELAKQKDKIEVTSKEPPVTTPKPIPTPEPAPTPAPSVPQESPLAAKIKPETIPEKPKIEFSFPSSVSEPAIEPKAAPKPVSVEPTKPQIPTIPKISFPSTSSGRPTTNPLGSTRRREEDRATGIAILRKQMLTELKKIRSVVSETEQQ